MTSAGHGGERRAAQAGVPGPRERGFPGYLITRSPATRHVHVARGDVTSSFALYWRGGHFQRTTSTLTGATGVARKMRGQILFGVWRHMIIINQVNQSCPPSCAAPTLDGAKAKRPTESKRSPSTPHRLRKPPLALRATDPPAAS